ncbi:leucine-rich repeats and immunoglobulin-like domains protein 2 [Aphidius gifuensis]|uniref:leucine-rich repeats and immunoglobulin-like domains protein 2 n=1 Tax=Aphidius gifuensis TaxID=684658 RepID=UPI001CDCD2D4|nr:leucine-rich repeats and immunoglobulin-like domains protein 2 [Aphidius gifuensis]
MIQAKTFQNFQCNLLDLTQNRLMFVDNRAFNSTDIDEIYFFKNQFFDVNISKWGISNTTLVFMDYKKYDSTFGPNNKEFIIPKKPYMCYTKLENLQIANAEKVSVCDVNKCKDIKLNISRLSYTFGSFISLQPADFFCLKKLKYLGITNSSLENIDSSAFDGLDSVKTLVLSSNELTHIDRDIFKKIINLNTLILSHNKINSIDDRAFESKTLSMLDLNLSYNEIKRIENDAFKDTTVKDLYLHNNSGIIVSNPAWGISKFTFVYIDNEYDTEIYCRILESQKNTACEECKILCGSYFIASRG